MDHIQKKDVAKCDTEQYIAYLMAVSKNKGCTRMADALPGCAHDAVMRVLERGSFSGKDLFLRCKEEMVLSGGVLSCDDTVLDKPHCDPEKNPLVGRHWSGKHKSVVQGICLVTMFYTDTAGARFPVNYKIYIQGDIKSKNDLFLEMLAECKAWGLCPSVVTGDSWYASSKNLAACRAAGFDALFAVPSDRLISTQKGQYQKVGEVDIPQEGLFTHLNGFDWVTVFMEKDEGTGARRHYVHYKCPRAAGGKPAKPGFRGEYPKPGKAARSEFEKKKKDHWNIECYHRALKHTCNAENFQVRKPGKVRAHIFSALCAFINLEKMVIGKMIGSWYGFREALERETLRPYFAQLTV
jgi:hypothetical protein